MLQSTIKERANTLYLEIIVPLMPFMFLIGLVLGAIIGVGLGILIAIDLRYKQELVPTPLAQYPPTQRQL
jgi:hypothetical protein